MPDNQIAIQVLLSVIGALLLIGISIGLYLYKRLVSAVDQLERYARENAIKIAENAETIKALQRALYVVEQDQKTLWRTLRRSSHE